MPHAGASTSLYFLFHTKIRCVTTVLFLLRGYFNSQCSAVNHPSRMASRAPIYLGVSILLLLPTALPFCTCTAQSTYYVKPTPDTPRHGDPCHTLSKYVSESKRYLISNTTMAFLPGDHTLHDNITVIYIWYS